MKRIHCPNCQLFKFKHQQKSKDLCRLFNNTDSCWREAVTIQEQKEYEDTENQKQDMLMTVWKELEEDQNSFQSWIIRKYD